MYKLTNRKQIRAFRKMRFWRKRLTIGLSKPRLCVFRSSKHIQAQVIDDRTGKILASASSIESQFRSAKQPGVKMAAVVGKVVAERSQQAGVESVVFDRNGFAYHGRIAALAGAAREQGLKF